MAQVTNVRAVQRSIRAEIKAKRKANRVALMKAGLHLQRESQKIVPVDTSLLKKSARTKVEGTGFDATCEVSYSTDYAVYVHEDLNARHKPGKQAKFLEQPARTEAKRIAQIYSATMLQSGKRKR